MTGVACISGGWRDVQPRRCSSTAARPRARKTLARFPLCAPNCSRITLVRSCLGGECERRATEPPSKMSSLIIPAGTIVQRDCGCKIDFFAFSPTTSGERCLARRCSRVTPIFRNFLLYARRITNACFINVNEDACRRQLYPRWQRSRTDFTRNNFDIANGSAPRSSASDHELLNLLAGSGRYFQNSQDPARSPLTIIKRKILIPAIPPANQSLCV